jgi:uncharacterized protein
MREQFLQDILANRHNASILGRWDRLGLPDGWLVAGCLFQTVWNLRSGFAPDAHIKDYDIFYFDAGDLSAEAEADVQRRVDAELADLGVTVEVKNQARVHLWYEDWFGHAYAALRDAREGIDRFLVPCTCVGVRVVGDGGLDLYAPNGLPLLYEGRLTPNPLSGDQRHFMAKALSYAGRWPWLRIEPGLPAAA